MPKTYVVESSYDFIEIAKTITTPKLLASLDVESLFTNVPVTQTIEIIMQNVYNHPTLPSPKVPSTILKRLLTICTTKTPFRSPTGQLYKQHNGVSMGSPLGPSFANYYMCHIENEIFDKQPELKPQIYCRYMDDIFLVLDNFHQLTALKTAFETSSILQFTYEIENRKQISFLDISVSRNKDNVFTTVYRKPTDTGACLNYDSCCPQRYKIGVIKNFLHRAYSVCSSWKAFTVEIERITQLLVNNNFPNKVINQTVQQFLDNKFKNNSGHNNRNRLIASNSDHIPQQLNSTQRNSEENHTTDSNSIGQPSNDITTVINPDCDSNATVTVVTPTEERRAIEQMTNAPTDETPNTTSKIKLFYRNQMTENYKQVEKELQTVIRRNIQPANQRSEVQLLIYYRNRKLKELFIKNNSNPSQEKYNVVYKYSCDQVQCNSVHACYIGYTTTTLKDRMKQHASIKKHYREKHNQNITGSQMLQNTTVIARYQNKQDLIIAEALYIKEERPIINTQTDDFNRTLTIF